MQPARKPAAVLSVAHQRRTSLPALLKAMLSGVIAIGFAAAPGFAESRAFHATADTHVDSCFPSSNYAQTDVMYVANNWGEIPCDDWLLLNFNLTTYPSGAIFRSATLYLYQHSDYSGVGSRSIAVYPASSSWDADTVTWNTRPGALGYVAYANVETGIAWREYDVSNVVARWLVAGDSNRGLVIKPNTGGSWMRSYRSRDYGTGFSYAARLEIVYDLPTPTLTRTTTRTPTRTRTPTVTRTPTRTTTRTPLSTKTLTATRTATLTPIDTATATWTATPTAEATGTVTATRTAKPTPIHTATATWTATPTAEATGTATATRTAKPTPIHTATATWTLTPTAEASATATITTTPLPGGDRDQDGVPDATDNCPSTPNRDQRDTDADTRGDACDPDDDGDTIADEQDNCPLVPNPQQGDQDHDGIGDLCDEDGPGPIVDATLKPLRPVLGDRATYSIHANDQVAVVLIQIFFNGVQVRRCAAARCDFVTPPLVQDPSLGAIIVDADGFVRVEGIAPAEAVQSTLDRLLGDADDDGVSDAVDNCTAVYNRDQEDSDHDGVGDSCDACCAACGDSPLGIEYCCYPTYGSGDSGCREQVSSYDADLDREVYYWEEIYDLVDENGCGCRDSDGDDTTVTGAATREVVEAWGCHDVSAGGRTRTFCDPERSTCEQLGDVCIDDNTVRERVCSGRGLESVARDCTYACEFGRCTCPDTDGGWVYFRRGSVLGHTDFCTAVVNEEDPHFIDWVLTEYNCGLDDAGNFIADHRSVTCPYGCEFGRCLCEDTDGGIDATEFGHMGDEEDSCIDQRRLSEVYPRLHGLGEERTCDVMREEIECPGSCVDGACVPATCDDGVRNQGEDDIDCGGPCGISCDLCGIDEDHLPARFDWRRWKGRSYVTAIRDQALCGSCWAHAPVAVVESKYNIQVTARFSAVDLAEQNLMSTCGTGDSCEGGSRLDALRYIRDTGIVDEACFAYTSGACLVETGSVFGDEYECAPACGGEGADTCANPQDCPGVCGDTGRAWGSRKWSIDEYDYVHGTNTREKVKDALLCHGPLVACADDWNHCIAVIGWDNDSRICRDAYGRSGCWIIKNSHGVFTDFEEGPDGSDVWHVDGFGYVPFDDHEYSSDMENYVRFVRSVEPPAP